MRTGVFPWEVWAVLRDHPLSRAGGSSWIMPLGGQQVYRGRGGSWNKLVKYKVPSKMGKTWRGKECQVKEKPGLRGDI